MKSEKSKKTKENSNGAETASASSEGLKEFLVNGLKDIYWAEKALVKALPKMAKNANSPDLAEALTNHLEETKEHVSRLEEVFSIIGEKATAKKCEAMEGLIKEGEETMKDAEDGVMMDAGIIASGQKVEHYEIATYGTLAAYAEILGYEDAVDLLRQTLEEEKAADEKLTDVTVTAVVLEEQD